ncbi:hypothetical protein C817_02591 [Dorea sp. 5-2]|nr:hypothetical protein C817_02591 [Dorea sp. 5-2]
MNMKYARRSEDTEQIQVMNWAHWHTGKYPELKWLHHIPNGGSRNRAEAAKLKEMGVKAGVSDLSLPCPKGIYCGMYVEMKYGNNRHTDRQKEFLADMAENGYFVVTCYSAEDAIKAIEEYVSFPHDVIGKAAKEYEKFSIGGAIDRCRMSIPNNSILKDGRARGGGVD